MPTPAYESFSKILFSDVIGPENKRGGIGLVLDLRSECATLSRNISSCQSHNCASMQAPPHPRPFCEALPALPRNESLCRRPRETFLQD